MTDYTRGDDPVYNGFREGWAQQEKDELQARIDELESENARLREAQRWIPVTERVPEPGTNVLIWQSYREDAPYSNITIGHLHQESDFRRKPYWTWIAHGADIVHPKIEAYHRAEVICPVGEFVTHWMPLPAAPCGKDGEGE